MFWLRNKKNNFQIHTLIWGPELNDPLMIKPIKLKVGLCLGASVQSDQSLGCPSDETIDPLVPIELSY